MLRLVSPVVSDRRAFRGYCDIANYFPRGGHRSVPFFCCRVCRRPIRVKTGACKRCAKERADVATFQRQQRINGVVIEIDYRDCALARAYGHNGRMYGSEAAHVSRAGKGLRR
jgi:hypothetical protein